MATLILVTVELYYNLQEYNTQSQCSTFLIFIICKTIDFTLHCSKEIFQDVWECVGTRDYYSDAIGQAWTVSAFECIIFISHNEPLSTKNEETDFVAVQQRILAIQISSLFTMYSSLYQRKSEKKLNWTVVCCLISSSFFAFILIHSMVDIHIHVFVFTTDAGKYKGFHSQTYRRRSIAETVVAKWMRDKICVNYNTTFSPISTYTMHMSVMDWLNVHRTKISSWRFHGLFLMSGQFQFNLTGRELIQINEVNVNCGEHCTYTNTYRDVGREIGWDEIDVHSQSYGWTPVRHHFTAISSSRWPSWV